MAAACVRMLRAASVGSLDTSSAEDDRRGRHGLRLRLSPLASPPATPASPCGTGCSRRRSASRARRQFGAAATQCGSRPEESAVLSPTKAPEKEIKSWRKGARIGQGSYGSVYKAIDKDLGRIFAVKEAVIGSSPDDTKYMDRLEDELKICSTLSHPNIVRYLGHESKDGRLCIFLEYAQGGSLAAILREFGPFQAGLARRATRGALRGLDYLHTRDPPIVHRDIKAANLLVDDHMNVKLADFGCSKRSSSTQSFTTIGSIPWMAPEVVASQAGHGRKADVWSLGCTVLEMFTAEKPWGDGAFDNIMRALWRIGLSQELPPIPEGIDDLGRIFIERCLRRQSDERPSSHDLLCDAFVSRQS